MEPIYTNCEKRSFALYSNENVISKINETSICKKSRDKKILHHALKIQLNLSIERESIANGKIKIKTLTITYLIEYEIARFTKPIEINA